MADPGPSIHEEVEKVNGRLDKIEKRLANVEQTLAEFRGGRKVLFWILGGAGSIAAIFLAAKGKVF